MLRLLKDLININISWDINIYPNLYFFNILILIFLTSPKNFVIIEVDKGGEKMKILSIDPSTKSTGIAIFEDNKLIEYKCITASSSNLFSRIEKMQNEIESILKVNKIDKVYMEDVLPEDVKNNQKVFKALMYLQGALCETFNKYKIEPDFLFPSEWRSKCGIKTGRGVLRESLKPKDVAFVKEKYGLDVNDDIADAICIGYAAIRQNKIVIEDGFEFR